MSNPAVVPKPMDNGGAPSLAAQTADIQINILRGLASDRSAYYFLKISDVSLFRKTLAVFAEDERYLRSEAERPKRDQKAVRSAINVAFSFAGLDTLGVDVNTLASFPQPFQQGMAARAAKLGDEGTSAPEGWEGWLGSQEVEAIVALHGHDQACFEEDCRAIETDPTSRGYRILQVERGIALFDRDEQGDQYRIEHFGFRDGISQPYVYLGGQRPPPGGGKARGERDWAPIAPGEFILGYGDEDGVVQPNPANEALRANATYMVFRKLAQDVAGFRDFLAGQRDGVDEQERLAAQMFGRWRNGSPLVQDPDGPKYHARERLNDFRYETEDPRGRKCPFGSHIRRINPRDTAYREDANRHRLIRRGIPFGEYLPDDANDDGVERGLLFVAFNARIDLQFEFLQQQWINRGEFMGQAGNRKDPIIGANNGKAEDQFIIPGQPGPVCNLPRFVHVKGGEYFFVPGIAALKRLAREPDGAADEPLFPSPPRSPNLGIAKSPKLFDSERLREIGLELLQRQTAPTIAIRHLPLIEYPGAPPRPRAVAIVAKRRHVERVLGNDAVYQVAPYAKRIAAISGKRMMIGMPSGDPEREKRLELLHAAVQKIGVARISELTRDLTARAIDGVRAKGALDLVGTIGRVVPIGLAAEYYGVAGPGWVSPTAIAAKFGKKDVGEVPADWLGTLDPVFDSEKPIATMQFWTRFAFLEIFVNIQSAAELTDLAVRSTGELLRHIDDLVERADAVRSQHIGDAGDDRQNPPPATTMLDCLIDMSRAPQQFDLSREAFLEHTRLLLAEMVVGGIETVNKALANVVDSLLDNPDALAAMQRAVGDEDDAAIDAQVRQALLFKPVSPALFRLCVADDEIELGETIEAGTIVCALLEAAGHDPAAPLDAGDDPQGRKIDYLHFGLPPHYCGGAAFAEAELREMLKQIVVLPNLRRTAGPSGRKSEFLKLTDSLSLRFDPF